MHDTYAVFIVYADALGITVYTVLIVHVLIVVHVRFLRARLLRTLFCWGFGAICWRV